MGKGSSIEWTESTWNPVTGCTKISPGCKHCYAERLAKRLKAMRQPNYRNGFKLTLQEHTLQLPLTWTKPQMVFVNSMSDLFHPDVPADFIRRVFDAMGQAGMHTFQVLTKRSERLAKIGSSLQWPSNVWMGVSVETPKYLDRIDHLRTVPAQTRFVSFEPLLAPLGDINFEGITWAIVGGESGPSARLGTSALHLEWHFSSSNGAERTRKKPVGYSTAEHGITCHYEWPHKACPARVSIKKGVRLGLY
jgi:protein gp37